MKTTKLGATGPTVSAIGLGCMGMSGSYGVTDEAEGIRTIHAAIERGINLIDTGDFYGMGHNEMLIGRALAGRRDKVHLSVKYGALRAADGSWLGVDTRPALTKTFLAYSLKRLNTDVIDVYRPSRLDPSTPIEDTVGAIADLIKAGHVRHIGLSEVGAQTIQRAARVHPIVDLQIEYAVASRGPEAEIFPALREVGMSATLYGVYARGLLTGSKPGAKGDWRGGMPRWSGEAGNKNAVVVEAIRRFAADHKRTPAQLALGWVLAKQPDLVPIIGARTVAQLEDALAVLDKPLSKEEVDGFENLGSITGDRYPTEMLRHMDSERRSR